jgi:hypothetical protein
MLTISSIITKIHDYISSQPYEYLYTYLIQKQMKKTNDLTPLTDLRELTTNTIYPMIIYYYFAGDNTYIIPHYFIIIHENDVYWMISSWGSDVVCVTPTVLQLDPDLFSRLLILLSRHEERNANKDEFRALMKSVFFTSPVPMYGNLNGPMLGALVPVRKGVELELDYFRDGINYHIAVIPEYNSAIHKAYTRAVSGHIHSMSRTIKKKRKPIRHKSTRTRKNNNSNNNA